MELRFRTDCRPGRLDEITTGTFAVGEGTVNGEAQTSEEVLMSSLSSLHGSHPEV